jgi:hypothetical protein
MKTNIYTISTKKWVYNLFYKLYWWLLFGPCHDSMREKSYRHNVYDNLGIIDTLGHSYSEGKFTYSYSEELGGYKGIKLPFGWCIEFDNEWDVYVILKKFRSLYSLPDES